MTSACVYKSAGGRLEPITQFGMQHPAYAAVKDGHGNDIADYLGMKYTEAYYALKKLEQGGRIKLEETGWVAA